MPFIDTTPALFTPKVTETDLQPRIGELLATAGWKIAANFKKVVYDSIWINPNGSMTDTGSYRSTVAEHFIYENTEGHMFGIAIAGSWSIRRTEYTKQPGKAPDAEFGDWATNEFRKYRTPRILYTYIVESLQGLTTNNTDIIMAWNDSSVDGQLRAALDIEVEKTVYKAAGSSNQFTVTVADMRRMQSPIIQAGLRASFMENYFDANVNAAVQHTNWWNDSEISIKGTLDGTNLFFIVQADNVPAPEGNLVPIIPLYFGKLDPIEEGDEAYALFAGSVPLMNNATAVAEYDFDNTTTRQPNIMPLLKNYPANPANGLDNIMVHRAKLGARYQAYYLSWNAPPNLMPPARSSTDGKRDYPRAWNNAENPLYKYNFNPSRYSDKVHTSRLYVVHPEEGVRGTLKGAIALAAFSFNANKLRVRKQNCPDEQFDVYRYFLVEGISPLTKKPGTQFRPAGLGLYLNTIDKEGNEVTAPIEDDGTTV